MHRHGLTDRMGIVRGHDASFAGAFDFDVHVEQSGAVGGDVDQRTTDAMRTPDQESMPISRQMPALATSMPQSQPKE